MATSKVIRTEQATYKVEDEKTVTNVPETVDVMLIEDVKTGEFVKLNSKAVAVYTKVGYCRINKAYELEQHNGSSTKYLKKGREVVIGFTY